MRSGGGGAAPRAQQPAASTRRPPPPAIAALHSAAAATGRADATAAESDDAATLVPWSTVEEVLAMAADALRAKQRTVDELMALGGGSRRQPRASAPVAIGGGIEPLLATPAAQQQPDVVAPNSLSSSLDPDSAMRLVRRCERAEEDSADLLAQLEALLAARAAARQQHEDLQRLADLLLAERALLAERLEGAGAFDDGEEEQEGEGGISGKGQRRRRRRKKDGAAIAEEEEENEEEEEEDDEEARRERALRGVDGSLGTTAPSSLCQAVEALAEEARRARALRRAASALLQRHRRCRERLRAAATYAAEDEAEDAALERALEAALRPPPLEAGAQLLMGAARAASPPPLQTLAGQRQQRD